MLFKIKIIDVNEAYAYILYITELTYDHYRPNLNSLVCQ
jgi:hypothetical protein